VKLSNNMVASFKLQYPIYVCLLFLIDNNFSSSSSSSNSCDINGNNYKNSNNGISDDSFLCKPHYHVVTQPTMKL